MNVLRLLNQLIQGLLAIDCRGGCSWLVVVQLEEKDKGRLPC